MGFRFRKSKSFGPFRINLSKSGVGYSVGTKGFRLTKKASGGVRATASLPGTGLSYSKDFSAKDSAKEAGNGDNEAPKKKSGCLKPALIVLAVLLGIGLIASLVSQNAPEEVEPPAAVAAPTEPAVPEPPAQPVTKPAVIATVPEETEIVPAEPETVPPETVPAVITEPTPETVPAITTQPAEAQIVFISWPETIGRGETGTVEIQGAPNTEYSITVEYKSGPSTASGLESKTSDAGGYVSWSWKVGGRTSPGTFTITVRGGGSSESVKFTVVE